MKLGRLSIAVVLAAVISFAAIHPAMAAETSAEGEGTTDITEGEGITDITADTIKEEVKTPDVAPVLERDPSEQGSKPQKGSKPRAAAKQSTSGSSQITWTDFTKPAVFDNTNVNLVKKGYLTAVRDGYMRVAFDGKSIVVEYYDDSFHMTRRGSLSMELEVWGGFYKGENAYYIAEGHDNTDGVDGTEVVRIIKYDTDWNRIGAGSVLAEEGWEYEIRYPFYYSCCNMCEVNGKLYVVTGRQGYVDPQYGMGHQGMMLIRMDEETFETEICYGDFSHSFAQFADNNGTDLYICELCEGGRGTFLSRFDTNRTGTDSFNAFSDRFAVLGYGGTHTSAWGIPCYASVDGIAVSANNVLCLGTSIDQSQYDSVSDDTPHNIYLTVTPLSNLNAAHTTVKWLTDYTGGGKSFLGAAITKVNNNRFLITWEENPGESGVTPSNYRDPLSAGRLHYLFVDGSGNKISEEFTENAMISDCHPILKGDQIVYYASMCNCLDFYTIDAQSGAFAQTVNRVAGNNVSWYYNAGVLSFSGSGELSVDPEEYPRYPESDTQGWYSYSGIDNCWKGIRDHVTTVNIGANITSIADKAFLVFDRLTTVSLPEGLQSIGKEAFLGCTSLGELTIPESVAEIGEDFLWTGYESYEGLHITYATINGVCNSYAIQYAIDNNIYYNAQHKWKTEVTKATTEKNGKIVKKCSRCGEIASERVIYYPKTITLSKTSMLYNGQVQKPEVTVEGSDGKVISADNYTLTYSEGCKEIGDYSVTIDFKGHYSGSVTKAFSILLGKTGRGDMFNLAGAVKVTWKAVPGAKYYKVYREGVTDPGESVEEPVIVTTRLYGGDKVAEPALVNGHAYRYRIVASTTGAGDDSGDSTLSYSKLMYRLKTVVLRSAKNTGPGEVTVKYDKTTSGDGYVLQYSENEDMTDARTKVVKGADNTTCVFRGLKKGKTYYISIRVRKVVDGIAYYTTFGVARKVTITR